jgi:hypothetical protein
MTGKSRYFWFLGIYFLSLIFYAVTTLVVRLVVKSAF